MTPESDDFDRASCKVCGSDMQWEHCWDCGGEGEFDGYEEDPLWYDPGEYYPCSICRGEGGFLVCLNVGGHPEERNRSTVCASK